MAGRLAGKVAIVTGSTSGIGRATAVLFAKEGARVVMAGRRENLGAEVEKEIRAAGGEAVFVRADMNDRADIARLVDTAVGKYGRVDILVNNAGVLTTFNFEDMDEEKDFDAIFATNVKGYFLLTKAVAPHMLKQGKGSVVNIASIGAEVGVPNNVSYSASKGAIRQFTRSLAGEYAKKGVRVNAVLPGLTNSGMVPVGSAFEQEAIKIVPMGRAAAPEEIAPGILFFASDESSFCTGSLLVMDGGATAL